MKKHCLKWVVAALTVIATLVGQVAPAAAIVGGTNASTQFAVSFQFLDSGQWHPFCAGVMITPDVALTAGHCARAIVPGKHEARVNTLNQQNGELVPIKRVAIHPAFDRDKFVNDLGLVLLDHEVTQQPFRLSTLEAGDTATFAGWGTTCDLVVSHPECRSSSSLQLQQLTEQRLDDSQCSNVNDLGIDLFVPGKMYCFVSADGQARQVCYGDSGAGGFKFVNGEWLLVAIVNGDGDDNGTGTGGPRDHSCTTAPTGGIGKVDTTKVDAYTDWIWATAVKIHFPSPLKQYPATPAAPSANSLIPYVTQVK